MIREVHAPTLELRYEFFPKAWASGVSRRVFELLTGPNCVYPATSWGNEGGDPLPTDPTERIDRLTDHYEAYKNARITLFTDEATSRFHFNLYRSEWHEDSTFGQRLFWPKVLTIRAPLETASTPEVLDTFVEVAAITEAPWTAIDYRESPADEAITTDARRETSRVAQGTIHGMAMSGPWRGLDRIPWRLIIGSDIVAMFGESALNALPSSQAIRHRDGLWSLQTSADPTDSLTPASRDVEREIKHRLGVHFFADTPNNRLAETVPSFDPSLVPDDRRLFEKYGEMLKPL